MTAVLVLSGTISLGTPPIASSARVWAPIQSDSPCVQVAVVVVAGERPVETGGLEARVRPTHLPRRQPRARGDLVLGNPAEPQTQNLAHAAHGNPPCWHQSAPQPKPKKRTLRTASRGFRYPSPPGDIIPEWWARIDRNAGRQLIGTGGRHHSGIGGRLPPESASGEFGRVRPGSPGADRPVHPYYPAPPPHPLQPPCG